MTITVIGCARALLFIGISVLMPLQISDGGMSYHVALANSAGGSGNGKGQGQSRAGSAGGSGATSAGANGPSAGASNNRGRSNLLNASVRAYGRASSNSPIGAMTQYSAALSSFITIDATDDPTAEELARILVRVAKKDELTPETINWIHEELLNKEMVTQTTLDDAASILAPPIATNADSNVATSIPTLAELIAEQASHMQESEPDQGLGPIY